MKIASADLGLGFFNAASGRVSRVIANKVYELMSLGIPVLTADSQGMREQFTHREHVFLCEPGSAEALCSAIKELKADKELRLAMAEKAYQKIQNDLTPAQVGKRFLADLVELVEKR
jgi:glycosyltransferase involved in cell wall biosynthesis